MDWLLRARALAPCLEEYPLLSVFQWGYYGHRITVLAEFEHVNRVCARKCLDQLAGRLVRMATKLAPPES